MKNKNPSFFFIVELAVIVLVGTYFTAFAAPKQFEGIWKPIKFSMADYEIGGFRDVPLTSEEIYGAGEKYLHFKGKTVCTDGILEGPRKKLCGSSNDVQFHEFFSTPLTAGGTTLNVWADDEKTYTFPLDIEIKGGKLIETFGSGSQKTYEKVTISKDKKKSSKIKQKTKSSSLDGVWQVDGGIAKIAIKGNELCTDWNLAQTKCFYDTYTKADGVMATGKMAANGQGITVRKDGKLEMKEMQKGTTYYVYSKLSVPLPKAMTFDEWLNGG